MSALLDGRAPTILTDTGARKLTDRIRSGLQRNLGDLRAAFHGRAWEALGHLDWATYCRVELPELAQLRLVEEDWHELNLARQDGMSLRALSAATGVSPETLRRKLDPLPDGATVTSLDGRRRQGRVAGREEETPEPQPDAPALSATDRALIAVLAQGDRGLTARELCLELGWHHGQASGALSRLAKRQQVTMRAERRLGFGVYIATVE